MKHKWQRHQPKKLLCKLTLNKVQFQKTFRPRHRQWHKLKQKLKRKLKLKHRLKYKLRHSYRRDNKLNRLHKKLLQHKLK